MQRNTLEATNAIKIDVQLKKVGAGPHSLIFTEDIVTTEHLASFYDMTPGEFYPLGYNVFAAKDTIYADGNPVKDEVAQRGIFLRSVGQGRMTYMAQANGMIYLGLKVFQDKINEGLLRAISSSFKGDYNFVWIDRAHGNAMIVCKDTGQTDEVKILKEHGGMLERELYKRSNKNHRR